MFSRPQMLFFLVWLTLYGVSLFTPALTLINFQSKDPPDIWVGWETIMLGWLGLYYGQIGWLANSLLVMIIPLGLLKKWRACSIFSAIALLIALSSLTATGLVVPRDEGGVQHCRIGALGPAFYIWLASFGVWIAAFPLMKSRQNTASPQSE